MYLSSYTARVKNSVQSHHIHHTVGLSDVSFLSNLTLHTNLSDSTTPLPASSLTAAVRNLLLRADPLHHSSTFIWQHQFLPLRMRQPGVISTIDQKRSCYSLSKTEADRACGDRSTLFLATVVIRQLSYSTISISELRRYFNVEAVRQSTELSNIPLSCNLFT